MNRLFAALRPFIRGVVRHSGLVLVTAFSLSAIGLWGASHLRIDPDLANLIPRDYASVQALERLQATVGGESDASVGIESPSFEANKAFAEALIPRVLALRPRTKAGQDAEPFFSRVEYRRENAFLKDNALYFATDAELDELEAYLADQVEQAKLEANPFYFDLEDDDEATDGDSTGLRLQEVYEDIVSTEYPISDDSTVLVLRFYPTGSSSDIGYIDEAYDSLQAAVDALAPSSFHPEMEVVLAGRLYRRLVEVTSIQDDVLDSFGAGVTAVLFVVLAYFLYKSYRARAGRRWDRRVLLVSLLRVPALAIVIGLPLLMSLTWTFGVASLVFGDLNLMTSTLGLVLFGLGIDYGIHFYARYSEERAHGFGTLAALELTFVSTGQAIAAGAMTTAAALYVLVLADFKGFSEFGFIAGNGILFALVAMLVVMPALLCVMERTRLLRLGGSQVGGPPPVRQGRFPGARGVVLAGLGLVVAALVLLPRVGFEYRFGELEPSYDEYRERNQVISQVYSSGGRRNPAYIVVDDPAEVGPIVQAVRAHAAADTLTPTIGSVESLQERFPLQPAAQQARLGRIARIRSMLDDPFIQAEESEELARLRQAAQTTAPIALEQVPEHLKKRFASKSGEIGSFVIIYPSVGLSDGRNSIAFSDDVGTVTTADGNVYHAGSTSLVAADMLRLMQREAPWMILATFVIVFGVMWLNFGSLRWALLALIPLVVGLLWMLLGLELFGMRLNFYNLIVLPAILGIGNDAGVHLVHRYREEGPGSFRRVLGSTGEHVAMGSLTTMIGFAGLLLSFHPGLRSIGELAVVGIGTTLLAALVFLPALLSWLEQAGHAPKGFHTNGAGPHDVLNTGEAPVGARG